MQFHYKRIKTDVSSRGPKMHLHDKRERVTQRGFTKSAFSLFYGSRIWTITRLNTQKYEKLMMQEQTTEPLHSYNSNASPHQDPKKQ